MTFVPFGTEDVFGGYGHSAQFIIAQGMYNEQKVSFCLSFTQKEQAVFQQE